MVQVFNEAGKTVLTLVNKELSVGQHNMACDMSGLPAGSYYCRLQNGPKQQVKSMVKVR
jgi:hypothetical protein